MKTISYFLTGFLILTIIACSKNKSGLGSGGGRLQGRIYYDYAGKANEVDLATNTRRDYFSINSYSFNNWDLSLDGKIRLQSEREAGEYQKTKFILLNAAENTTIREFEYTPPRGTSQGYSGLISPDNSMILLRPDYENGIIILDMEGNIKHKIDGVNNKALTTGDEVRWLPGNGLLITFDDKFILRSDPPYTNLTLVKEIAGQSWGSINPDRDGKRISFYMGDHIYLMNIDGSDMKQITESSAQENTAVFSPDGAWLVVGADYVHAPVSGRSSWKLKVIPADGKKYNLDSSPEVILIEPSNDNLPVTSSGKLLWR